MAETNTKSDIDVWMGERQTALLVDLYELTMLQAYWREKMFDRAVFSLFTRRLPERRHYLIACGLDDALRYLERLRFSPEALDYLATRAEFSKEFLDWLREFRFTGDVHALPEGTVFFGEEPILEVEAPLPEAQIAETFLMNQMNFQTILASKAARVVDAAGEDRAVIDFGMRRTFGTDAALKSSRAFHIAGVKATSNVAAEAVYGIPIAGTMAHSYIQAHESEEQAFRRFVELYPETVLLVDTFDTLEGVRRVVRLAKEMGDAFRVRAVRLDSGDLQELAFASRRILDEGGLRDVSIFASSSLDEYKIQDMVRAGAPIDGFGVGTRMGVSEDAPSLDMVYKLTSYAGKGRLKTSSGKSIYPGRKQVFREEENGVYVGDVVARHDESGAGEPLLRQVMADGKRLPAGRESLQAMRERAARERSRLPAELRGTGAAKHPYKVSISPALQRYQEEVIERVENRVK